MPRAVKCPFYVSARNETIKCESGLRIIFPDVSTRLRFWRETCCGDWEVCRIAAVLGDRWERVQGK